MVRVVGLGQVHPAGPRGQAGDDDAPGFPDGALLDEVDDFYRPEQVQHRVLPHRGRLQSDIRQGGHELGHGGGVTVPAGEALRLDGLHHLGAWRPGGSRRRLWTWRQSAEHRCAMGDMEVTQNHFGDWVLVTEDDKVFRIEVFLFRSGCCINNSIFFVNNKTR